MEEKRKDKRLVEKSSKTLQEEGILEFWRRQKIFEKSLQKPAPAGEFVFYEGPPTANGKPGVHHLESRAFKDIISRYKTMRGFHVRRKAGWDTHGLPVEIEVEKELGLKSKKEIEQFGIAKFNKKCRESVLGYIDEWNRFTERIGYWVDQDNAYFTFKPEYMETLWWIVKQISERGLLYKDHKITPWCIRCGTGLSSHEMAQGYQDTTDISVYVRFELVEEPGTYVLAWTTTPWTLPGNVSVAVNPNVSYVKVKIPGNDGLYILAEDLLNDAFGKEYEIVEKIKAKNIAGKKYKPIFDYYSNNHSIENIGHGWTIELDDTFVTTESGTGIVHMAPPFGDDLGIAYLRKYKIPFIQHVAPDGTFKPEVKDFAGLSVKPTEDRQATDIEIIKHLAKTGALFAKRNYTHSYPHCWRCKTPLIYYARDSWYVKMSALRDELVRENKKINWEPEHIKEGRFGEWLREVKDWAFSRERYWGTPLPVWECKKCGKREVIGSIEELKNKTLRSGNQYFVIRHGGTEGNISGEVSFKNQSKDHLTEDGKKEVSIAAKKLKKHNITQIFSSPFVRARETAEIIAETINFEIKKISYDERLEEMNPGNFGGTNWREYHEKLPKTVFNFYQKFPQGESYADVKRRVSEFLFEIAAKYSGENILIITHGAPAWLLASGMLDAAKTLQLIAGAEDFHYFKNADCQKLNFRPYPHNEDYELDLHRPYIDELILECKCGGEMKRTPEVIDVWFDSGAMPFAQDADKRGQENFEEFFKLIRYPADFISEAIDQTRGWFYTLLAIGVLLGRGAPYKNVISLGHILDEKGKKMSKSIGNVVDPWVMADKYGVDALRFWMYSVNQPGESKNFDEHTVQELAVKPLTLLENVLKFYELYQVSPKPQTPNLKPHHILDQWILAYLAKLTVEVTNYLENYKVTESTRAIREFIFDLSQWYVRRSRERIKFEGAPVLKYVLAELSKLLAPFTPFIAEKVYKAVDGPFESVHLENWPKPVRITKGDFEVLENMRITREIVSQALELRAKAGIKVRQPLAKLRIMNKELGKEYLELIREEVNVKKVAAGDELALDIIITPELKKEGEYRNLIREVQDLRKERGLKPGDLVTIALSEKYKEILAGLESEFQKTVSAKEIKFTGDQITLS